MTSNSINVRNDLAKALAITLGKSVKYLDKLDSKNYKVQDGRIYLTTVIRKMPKRFHDSSRTMRYGPNNQHEVLIINNSDKDINGSDMVIITKKTHNGTVTVGGYLNKIFDGYELDKILTTEFTRQQLPEHTAARLIWEEIQAGGIKKFADFKKSDYKKIFNNSLTQAIKGDKPNPPAPPTPPKPKTPQAAKLELGTFTTIQKGNSARYIFENTYCKTSGSGGQRKSVFRHTPEYLRRGSLGKSGKLSDKNYKECTAVAMTKIVDKINTERKSKGKAKIENIDFIVDHVERLDKNDVNVRLFCKWHGHTLSRLATADYIGSKLDNIYIGLNPELLAGKVPPTGKILNAKGIKKAILKHIKEIEKVDKTKYKLGNKIKINEKFTYKPYIVARKDGSLFLLLSKIVVTFPKAKEKEMRKQLFYVEMDALSGKVLQFDQM